MPPEGVELNWMVAPRHTFPVLPAAVILGGGEIKMEAVAVQAPVLVAVTVYVPALLTAILAEVCPVLQR